MFANYIANGVASFLSLEVAGSEEFIYKLSE